MNANDEKYYVDPNTDEYAGYIGTTQSNEEPANHDSVSGGSSQEADKPTIAGVAENNPTYLVPTGNHRQHPLSDKTTIFYRQQDQKQRQVLQKIYYNYENYNPEAKLAESSTDIVNNNNNNNNSGGGGNSGSEHGGESTQPQNQPKVPNQDYGTGYVGYKDEKIKYHPLIDVPKENRNYYEFVLANPYPYANLDPLLA
ncbi:hypothetical protein AX774_g3 [Zancudomyces culisetae]|uniref:Uncharacterized protein n=1 Tax=Zancudomyces culisetae TaxID=1213189 RepID=A0A1R1PZN8_ZANCU|nr:hypothetical protein AX774_g3 [Zancudomyces culisetae]|eukprot:OMH86415.1 hypothetical protein AX774_g3 [Zancudomyces culisetae]